jgi:hypothetical protein
MIHGFLAATGATVSRVEARRGTARRWSAAVLWLGSFLPGVLLAAEPVPAAISKNVPVIYSATRTVQANSDIPRGLQERLVSRAGRQVRIFEEFLDQSSFSGPEYYAAVETFLRDKYRRYPPDLLVVAGPIALDFLVRHRDRLFPGVPTVHVGVDEAVLRERGPLPAGVVGVPAVYDTSGASSSTRSTRLIDVV